MTEAEFDTPLDFNGPGTVGLVRSALHPAACLARLRRQLRRSFAVSRAGTDGFHGRFFWRRIEWRCAALVAAVARGWCWCWFGHVGWMMKMRRPHSPRTGRVRGL